MLKIYLPQKFQNEAEYTMDVLFKFILKLQYCVVNSDNIDFRIELPNGKEILIKNAFWNNIEENSFILEEYLPKRARYFINQFSSEKDIPVIYGEEYLNVSNHKIICGVDLIASSYFMLSRWEEIVDNKLDEHERVKAKESFAYKNNFLHRPVVNEYAEMLWNMLVFLGYNGSKRENVGYKIIPTHDVDKIFYAFNWVNFLGDILIDRNLRRAYKRITLPPKNYWDTFDWLMTQSEKNGCKSIFYFMADSDHKLDNRYSLYGNFVTEKITEIKRRGHGIGIHPGYGTMLQKNEWLRQKDMLEEIAEIRIKESRQHYLRFRIPETIRIAESSNVEVESSLCYADKVGFRCGTSCEYPLFDPIERRKTNLIERPLIIMDTILRDRKNTEKSAIKAVEVIDNYKAVCKKYDIPLTMVFHNNSFDPIRWNGWKEVYENKFLT